MIWRWFVKPSDTVQNAFHVSSVWRIIQQSVAVGDHEQRKGRGILDGQSISSQANHGRKAKHSSLQGIREKLGLRASLQDAFVLPNLPAWSGRGRRCGGARRRTLSLPGRRGGRRPHRRWRLHLAESPWCLWRARPVAACSASLPARARVSFYSRDLARPSKGRNKRPFLPPVALVYAFLAKAIPCSFASRQRNTTPCSMLQKALQHGSERDSLNS